MHLKTIKATKKHVILLILVKKLIKHENKFTIDAYFRVNNIIIPFLSTY